MTRILAGNWKMNLGIAEARSLLESIRAQRSVAPNLRIVLFPPYTALAPLAAERRPGDPELGAQNCHAEPKGAFTGEIAAEQVRDAGAAFVLVGHSERRRLFGENDALLGAKLRAAWRAGLTPFLCVGETLAERERHHTRDVLARQLGRSLEGAPPHAPLVVAYEPVWAIGTGVVATPSEVAEAHAWTREELERAGRDDTTPVPVLYGGSVDPKAAGTLSALPEVDGFLVGGASLSGASFLSIARSLEEARTESRGAR
ncbi:MAG TPA: triose-phosphate isomerase [Candidatus Eisenbacteria bacterium]|jgi:triosephosphate isomerase